MSRRVVITGAGAITPVGNDVATMWESVKAGRSGIATITRYDVSDLGTQFGGMVEGFDPAERLGRKQARRMDRVTHLALEACYQAIASSRLLETPVNR